MPEIIERVIRKMTPWYDKDAADKRSVTTDKEVKRGSDAELRLQRLVDAYRITDIILEKK